LTQPSRFDREGWDVPPLAIDLKVSVADQLSRLGSSVGEAHPEHHVVQPQLQLLEQILAGLTLCRGRAVVVAAELTLEQTVHPLHLLLLAQLHAVAGELHAPLAMLGGRIGAPLDRALIGVAAISLQIHLQIFSSADATNAGGVTCQVTLLHACSSPTRARPGAKS